MTPKQYIYIRSLLRELKAVDEKFEKLESEKDSMDEERASGNIKFLLKRIKDRK